MRILELYLKAFGCFSDRRIELPDLEGPGLCVIHGANEAGKSTALRAIRDLIYGIPVRSSDDFVHRYADMRVGARLRFGDGEELGVMRRKKARGSLYSYDDQEVIESDRLSQLADAVPELLFERFYGLDHRSLTEGSDALLQDDGEVGRALFGAGLGVTNLRAVLAELESEAAELFAPRASSRRINADLAALRDAQKEIRTASLDPKLWQEQEEVVRAGEASLEQLAREIEKIETERSRLQRLKRSLPALDKRRSARARLETLSAVPTLQEDFEARLTESRAARRAAEEARRRALAKIERETARRDALALAPDLLAEQERIEALHQRVDGYQRTFDQLPRRESELAGLDAEIEELLGAVGTPDAERLASLRAAIGQAGRIQALASEGAKFEDRREKAKQEVVEAGSELALLRSGSEEGEAGKLDAGPLRRAVNRALKLGPLDERIEEQRSEIEALGLDAEGRGRRLGLGSLSAEQIAQAPFPSHEVIEAAAQAFGEHAARVEGLSEDARSLRDERRRIDEELSKIRSRGAVPSTRELDDRRAEREEVWRELRQDLVDSDARRDSRARRTLADRFEERVSQADEIADRLRIDAERVAAQTSLEARAVRLDRELGEIAERSEALDGGLEGLSARWTMAWDGTGADPRPLETMASWRRELDELRTCLARRQELGRSLERDEVLRAETLALLRDALALIGKAPEASSARLEAAVSESEGVLERLSEQEAALRLRADALERAAERDLRAANDEERATAALAGWRVEWAEAVSAFDLPADTRSDRVLERIEAMRRLLELIRERERLADRVEKMRKDAVTFERDVTTLVGRCAPELHDYPPRPATLRLQRMLGDARKQQTLHGSCVEALSEAREELDEAETGLATSAGIIQGLQADAGVTRETDLDEALRGWKQLQEASRDALDAESELSNLAEGISLASLEEQGRGTDPDVLNARIAALDSQHRERMQEQNEAIAELRSQRDQLDRMNGSARVAELAEAAESRVAAIRRDVERYVQLRMAKQILEREIERYRNENQAPLLQRAGELFRTLTIGAYPRIVSEVDDAGAARLVAVNGEGGEVAVEGLSSGTRDQLFLALRLASLEESFARGESMPLVADDILIEFDDARARATLETLAELGRKNQILLFTHHSHIAEIARELGGKGFVVDL